MAKKKKQFSDRNFAIMVIAGAAGLGIIVGKLI